MNAPEQHRTHGFSNSRTCGSGKAHTNFHIPAHFLLENLDYSTRAAIPWTWSSHGQWREIPKIHQETSVAAPRSSFIFKNVFSWDAAAPRAASQESVCIPGLPQKLFWLKILRKESSTPTEFQDRGTAAWESPFRGFRHCPEQLEMSSNKQDSFPQFSPLGLCRHQENPDFPAPASPYMEGFIPIEVIPALGNLPSSHGQSRSRPLF